MTTTDSSPASPRWATERNHDRPTLGPAWGRVAAALGVPETPWQRLVGDVAGELDTDGTLWYREVRVSTPRQVGKTTRLLTKNVHRALTSERLGWGARPRMLFTMQKAQDARSKLINDMAPLIEGSPAVGRHLRQVLRSNGHEALIFTTGARIECFAPTKVSGHGGTVDGVDIDEAFAHKDDTPEQGARPAMITRASPQLWITSTAGDEESLYWWSKVDDGRARCEDPNPESRIAYFEWSAADDLDLRDPRTWPTFHPGIGNTIRADALAAELDAMPFDMFERAYGNRWPKMVQRIIGEQAWKACLEPDAQLSGELHGAIETFNGQTAIAFACRRPDGRIGVEVAEHLPGQAWVVPWVLERDRIHHPRSWTIDGAGPARQFVPDLERRFGDRLKVLGTPDAAAAAHRFHAGVLEGSIRHRGQVDLDAAAAGASKRLIGDSWVFGRRTSNLDITPLNAVVMAAWSAATTPVRGPLRIM